MLNINKFNYKTSRCFVLIVILVIVFLFIAPFAHSFASPVIDSTKISTPLKNLGEKAGFKHDSLGLVNMIATIISAVLGLLGVIFLILIIFAGYNWMTAAGEEEKVTKAKDTLTRAIIGLVIIICAYLITIFVFSHLPGGGTPPVYGPNPNPGINTDVPPRNDLPAV